MGPVMDEVTTIRPCPEASSAGRHAWTAYTGAFEVRGHDGLKVLGCHVGQPRRGEDSGVRTQHVNATVALDRDTCHVVASSAVTDFGLMRGYAATKPRQ